MKIYMHSLFCALFLAISFYNHARIVCLWDFHDTLVVRDNVAHYTLACKLAWLTFVMCPEAVPLILEAKDRKAAGEHTEQQLLSMAYSYETRAHEEKINGNISTAETYTTKANYLRSIAAIIHNFELIFSYRKGMVELIQELKACGVTEHYIASNTGTARYQELKQTFPEILNEQMVQDGLIVDTQEMPFLYKPHYMFFRKLKHIYNPNNDTTVIFIDDLQENVEAARTVGFIGICMKNVQQLRTELQKQNILT